MGIQSFNPQHLQALGRVHNQAEALMAADIARHAGFTNFNLDLMFGLPQQTLSQALDDLQQAIQLQPTHISWYQLTLEPNTLFYKQPPVLPDEDLLVDMQMAGQALLAQQAFQQYEVSAYSQAQSQCVHNRNYWEFGDYIGIGAGAHGKYTNPATQSIHRYQKPRQPADYMQRVQQGQARSQAQTLVTADIIFEFMLNALRLQAGFPLSLFTERTGLAVELLSNRLQQSIQRGLLEINDDWVKPSALGWQFLNTTIRLFLPD
jgi:oxygen-independent coproporphyrinogen-3 oxidase